MSFKKTLNFFYYFLDTIMLKYTLKNIQKYIIILFFQIMLLVSKLFLNNGYKSLKVYITYFLFIILIPNFYDMYIMYSK